MTALLAIVNVALLLSPEGGGGRSHSRHTAQPGSIQRAGDFQSPELAEAATLTSSVLKLYQERKYAEALPLAKRVVQLRETVLSDDEPLLRSALINLGQVYLALGSFKEAESSLERVVKSYEKSQPSAPRLAEVLHSLALVHYAKGELDSSEKDYQRALEITDKAFGHDSNQTARAVFNLAEFYQFTGDYKKGEPFYQRLVSIQQKGSTPAQKELLAVTVDRYACLLRKANRNADAKALEDQTLGPARQPSSPADEAAALSNVLNGKAISLPFPSYPLKAWSARIDGTVSVRVVVDETGNVLRVCAISGPRALIRESELAAARARFAPTKINSVPVKVTGVINYRFIRHITN